MIRTALLGAKKIRTLVTERRLPWRLTHLGGFWNTSVLAPIRRPRLWAQARSARLRGEDVAVVIGIRNRPAALLLRALKSIRWQSYPATQVEIVVVDYGSDPARAEEIRSACGHFHARYVPIAVRGAFSRSHCLNIGIRRCRATYIMTSDSDIILAPNYVAEAIAVLRKHPLSVVYSPMLDLPEGAFEAVEPETDLAAGDMPRLRELARRRTSGDCHESINITYRAFFEAIHGYDELYEGWGGEDNDIAKRFLYLGLEPRTLKDVSYYLHQWHARFEGWGSTNADEQNQRNRKYLESNESIVRNRHGWGDLGVLPNGVKIAD